MAVLKFLNTQTGLWETLYVIKGEDGHSPYIGGNDNWWEWNYETNKYEDSGQSAVAQIDESTQIEFIQAETKENIVSGESVSSIFGKLMKWFASFGSLAWKSTVDFATDVTNKATTLAGYGITDAYTKTGSDALITQLIDGATDNTLKKLQDKITSLQSIVGGTTPNGNGIIDTVTELLSVFNSYPEGSNLATLLGAKVNVTDVYNALDCVIAGKTLDARQGKALNDAILALSSGKVDKVVGKGLSTEDYTTAEKTKLSGITAGAQVNNISDVNATDLTDGGATTLHKHSYNNLDDKPTLLTLGTTSTTAARGDYGDSAYSFSQYMSSYNTVTSIASLPTTKRSIVCNLSASGTLSLANTNILNSGKELFIKVRNSGTAKTITLPNTGDFESKKPDGTAITSVTVPASGSIEISIMCLDKYIIKTDA